MICAGYFNHVPHIITLLIQYHVSTLWVSSADQVILSRSEDVAMYTLYSLVKDIIDWPALL